MSSKRISSNPDFMPVLAHRFAKCTAMKSKSEAFKALFGGGLTLLLNLTLAGPAAAQTWTQLFPTGGPPAARHSHTAVYDPGSNRMIVFGGRSEFGPTLFNDVWVLTSANGLSGTPQWIQLLPATPSGAPAPRWIHGAGYDAANNIMIVFGGGLGSSSPCVNDVWLLTNANGLGGTPTWMPLATTGSVPGVRFAHLFAYADALNRVIIAGGSDCFVWPYNGQAFALTNANGLGGTPTWTNLAPSGFPSLPTHRGAHIYDPASDRLVNWGAGPLNELRILAGASGTTVTPAWSTLALAAGPTTNEDSLRTAVYNGSSNRAVFFGGFNVVSGTDSNETWRLQNANGVSGTPSWSQVFPSGPTPPARDSHTAVYHVATDRMIIFGGAGDPPAFSAKNDVWVLTNATGNTPPVAKCQNVTVNTTPGLCSAPASVNNGSFDPNGDPIALAQSPPGPYSKGMTNVTLTVTDNKGASSSCSAAVTVVDKQPPTITCPAPQLVDSTGPNGAAVSFSPTASDNCAGPVAVSYTPPSGSVFPVGSTSVTCAATDVSQNTSTCSFTVTVLSPSQMTSNLTTTATNLAFQQGVALLQNALNQINLGNTVAACNQLNAFINQVQAQSGLQLTVGQANQLIASANQIRAALGCP